MPLAVFPKCFLSQLCDDKTMTVREWIDMAATLDIDGLEFYWGFTPRSDDEAREARRYAEAKNLPISMMCYSPDFIQSDPARYREEIEQEKRAIEISAILGCRYCRVLSGQRKPDIGRDKGVALAADAIAELIPHAERHGITLVLENHYKDGAWIFPEFAQKMDIFLQLLSAIPESPFFGVNYDPSNTLIAGEDPIAMLHAVKHRVVTMHASDRYLEGGTLDDLSRLEAHPRTGYASILKHGVIGQGLNDYDAIFSILAKAGFDGWISIEDGQDPDCGMEHLRLSAEFLRAKMKEHGLR
ncbi:MAG: sugar phosphate isomerase/epimerase [Capsulimonadaceae bacterium]|nr:sugar phosphate isomerase/epimerase [Capsulimonadaceae bacterium]